MAEGAGQGNLYLSGAQCIYTQNREVDHSAAWYRRPHLHLAFKAAGWVPRCEVDIMFDYHLQFHFLEWGIETHRMSIH